MLKPLWMHLDAIASRLRAVDEVCVGCDFDGTLTDIVSHPGVAVLSRRARTALGRVSSTPRLELGVFSGRKLDDLRAMVWFPGTFLSGTAGFETLDAYGTRRLHLDPSEALPEEIRESLRAWCERFDGAWLEDKTVALAVHYRAVAERFRPAFCSGVRRRFAPLRGRARLVHGKKVFEVLPALHRDKSTALIEWLGAHEGALPFYFGDDANDEVVYPAVRARGGIAVAVGRTASRAEYALAAPGHVIWFLEWLTREWREIKGSGARVEPEPPVGNADEVRVPVSAGN